MVTVIPRDSIPSRFTNGPDVHIGDPRIDEVVSASPYIWLYEFEIPKDPPTRLRLAKHPTPVEWGTDSSGATLTYSPFPVSHREIKEDSEGSIPTVVIQASNVTLEVQRFLADYDLVGQEARVMLVRWEDAPNGTPLVDYSFEVLSLEASPLAVTARCGRYNLNRQPFPLGRFRRNFCRWRYKSAECGYGGGLASCSKLLDGDNGCEAHDNEERFGGFPGLPRGSGLGS